MDGFAASFRLPAVRRNSPASKKCGNNCPDEPVEIVDHNGIEPGAVSTTQLLSPAGGHAVIESPVCQPLFQRSQSYAHFVQNN
jgi:hypothetical protein